VREYEAARQLAAETAVLIQERNAGHPDGGPEASRKTAAARRALGGLGVDLDRLVQALDGPGALALSEPERLRRRDALHALRARREQMQQALRRAPASAGRRVAVGEQRCRRRRCQCCTANSGSGALGIAMVRGLRP
jgi:SYP5 family syntaxin